MAGEMSEKANKIVELFKTMSYETKDEDQELFKQWKISHPSLKPQAVVDLQNKVWPKIESIKEPFERTVALIEFANLIEKSLELICQIYAKGNIRKDDTKKGVQVLVDYLRFYATCSTVLNGNDPKGDVLCIFDAYVYPGLLGIILGPILTLGKAIVIAAEDQLDIYILLSEIASEAGFHLGTISVLNVDQKVSAEFPKWNKCSKIIHLGYEDILDSPNSDEVWRLLSIKYGKSPMIVFDSADQQGACEVLIDAVWAYNGQLPWSVDTVFVQENIWDNFLTKLKHSINQHSLDFASQKIQSSELDEKISEAKNRGIEIYQGEKGDMVTFIGQHVYENNVIKANKKLGATLTVLPFRTLNEGIALANNNRQGLAASIWGENISQVNEAARKLQVGTVWINSFGVLKPNVSFQPWKESGFGYFGGVNALLEHHFVPKLEKVNKNRVDSVNTHSLYSVANSSQISWAKLGFANRSKTLLSLIEVLIYLDDNVDEWITAIYKSLNTPGKYNFCDFNDYDLKCFNDPVGIIAFEDISSPQKKLLLFTALLLGNVVILAKNNETIVSILTEAFPKGVFNIIENIGEAIGISNEQNIMIFVKNNGNKQKVGHIDEISAELLYITRHKIVWTSFGQTYC